MFLFNVYVFISGSANTGISMDSKQKIGQKLLE